MSQLVLPINLDHGKKITRDERVVNYEEIPKTYLDKLTLLLSQDLDFCGNNNGNHGSHSFHSFPAKFPPDNTSDSFEIKT